LILRTLTVDWLICQAAKTHFLTEPTSPFIGRSRNPIRSSDAKSTRTAPRRQPLFSKNFRFLSNPLILLGETAVASPKIPLGARRAAGFRDAFFRLGRALRRTRTAPFRPIFALSACVLRRAAYAVSRRARTHSARASKG
jgi:hypothetical protein